MAAHLSFKCKHLCMLKFRAVSPSFTKNSMLRISDHIINLIIWSQLCKERFIVHFTFQ